MSNTFDRIQASLIVLAGVGAVLLVLGLVGALTADRLFGKSALLGVYRESWDTMLEAIMESPVLSFIPVLSLLRWQSFACSEDQLRDWMDRAGWLRRRRDDA